MRDRLGDGYTETLRLVYPDVPETVDYVMYWWHKAAELVRQNACQRFGLVTTNTISQFRQRSVIELHQKQNVSLKIFFAVPDHPWTDEGAAVRIAMTGAELTDNDQYSKLSQIGHLTFKSNRKFSLEEETPEDSSDYVRLTFKKVGLINSNLKPGVNLLSVVKLKSNLGISFRGFEVGGKGFIINSRLANHWLKPDSSLDRIIKPYFGGKEFASYRKDRYVIDFHNLTQQESAEFSLPFQHLLEQVKPFRSINEEQSRKEKWWLFRRSGEVIRASFADLKRYIATIYTSKHRVFTFLDKDIMPDATLVLVASEDAYKLGVLSSCIHIIWALAAGGTLEDRPRYNQPRCFDPFPFPDPTPDRKQKIRELGERLDAHRKRVQAQHPDVTITAMYNLLEKIRAGEELTEKDREFNNKALVSTLKQIHDELDAAVFGAYGWEDLISPSPLTPLPEGEGNRNLDWLPSPLGRRAGDEGISKLVVCQLYFDG